MSTVLPGDSTHVQNNLQRTISAASNASPIVIQTTAPHGYATNHRVSITGVVGNTAANGAWRITVTDATHFALQGSSGNGAYVSGGISVDTSLTPAMAIPSDNDPRNAASVNVPFEALADRTQVLAELIGNIGLQSTTFEGSGTYITGPFETRVVLIGYGGGGGGGGGAATIGNSTQPFGGGGGGATVQQTASIAVAPLTAYSIIVGSGGGGGAGETSLAVASPGNNGGATTFGALAAFAGASGGNGGNDIDSASFFACVPLGGTPTPHPSLTSPLNRLLKTSDDAISFNITKTPGLGGAGGGSTANYVQGYIQVGATSITGWGGGLPGTSGTSVSVKFGGGAGGGGAGGQNGGGGNGGNGGNAIGSGIGSIGAPGVAAAANSGAGGGGGGGAGSGTTLSTGGNGAAGGSGRLVVLSAFASPISAPSITLSSIFPTFGGRLATGIITIRVNGSNFVSGCGVTVGGIASPGVTFINSTALDIVVPTLPSNGAYSITVTNPDLSSSTLASVYYAYNMNWWVDADYAPSRHLNGVDGKLETWDDISVNGLHITQTNTLFRPTVSAAAVNGRTGIDCAGGKMMSNTVANIIGAGGAYTFIICAKGGNGTLLSIRVSNRSIGNMLYTLFGTQYASTDGGGGTISVPTPVSLTNAFKSMHVWPDRTASTMRLYFNGALQTLSVGSAMTIENGATGFTLGNNPDNQSFSGIILEAMLAPEDISVTVRNAINAYFFAKWGVVG